MHVLPVSQRICPPVWAYAVLTMTFQSDAEMGRQRNEKEKNQKSCVNVQNSN